MTWDEIWFDAGRERPRSGWRVLIFLVLALVLTFLFVSPLALGAKELGAHLGKHPLLHALLWWTAAVPAFTLAGFWALRHLERLPPRTLGISPTGPWLRHVLLGLAAGIGLMAALVLLLWLAGAAEIRLSAPSPRAGLLMGLITAGALIAATAEELAFRGYIFQTLLRGIGAPATLLFTSACFAGLHVTNPGAAPIALTNIFIAGVMFGLLYLRVGSLWLPIGLHAGWNLGQWLFGLPVSGIHLPAAAPFPASLTGPAWLVGDAFGLEGGALVSLLILGLITLLAHTRRGLPLASRWWEWSAFRAALALPPAWDFSLNGRHYQWKLLTRTPPDA